MSPIRKRPRAKRRTRRVYPIDAAWKSAIRGLMVERGLNQAQLATMIGASPPAIVLLFKAASNASSLVPSIHSALGLVAPGPVVAIKAA